MANKRPCPSDTVVSLNVGGWRFDVARETLERSAFFRACLSGAFARDDGCLFLDRDGHIFKHVLSWLRTGQRPGERIVAKYKAALLHECEFFCLPDLRLNLLGKTSNWHLRPADRSLRAAEQACREGRGDESVLDVYAEDAEPRDAAGLEVPLLFDGPRRLQLRGGLDDFRRRLGHICGQSLLAELRALRLEHLYVAGGSVTAALTDSAAGDVDLFLTCPEDDAIRHLRAVYAAVQRAHSEAAGARAPLLVTRSAAAVTLYRHVYGGPAVAPVQMVLGLSRSVADLLRGFDVDCCCVAYGLAADRVVTTPRGLRALRHGACLVDTDFDSPSYCPRLEKYGLRGWRIGVPGLEELRVPHNGLHVMAEDVVLTLTDGKTPCRDDFSLPGPDGRVSTVKPTFTQPARVLHGPARLWVVGKRLHRSLEEVRLLMLGCDRAMLLHGVPPAAAADELKEDEGCSKAHLEAAVKLLESRGAGGGAVGRTVRKQLTGKIAFVYDVANASTPLEACECLWNAARCGLEAEPPETFLEKHGVSRELRFESGLVRNRSAVDWWAALYNS